MCVYDPILIQKTKTYMHACLYEQWVRMYISRGWEWGKDWKGDWPDCLTCYKEHMLPFFKLNFWFWDNCRFTCSSHEIICREILCALSFPFPPMVTRYTSIALDHNEDIATDTVRIQVRIQSITARTAVLVPFYIDTPTPRYNEPTQQWIHFQ